MANITISPEVYDEVLNVARWYAAMPQPHNFFAGDRFHENVRDFFLSAIPDNSYDEDQYFFSHFEIVNDELFAYLGQQDGSDNDLLEDHYLDNDLQVKVVRG